MPKKQVTQEQINKIIKKSKKNFKYSLFDFGKVSDRLKKAAAKWQGLNKAREDNSQLTKNEQGALVISNNKNVKTEVALNTNREYYEENSFTTALLVASFSCNLASAAILYPVSPCILPVLPAMVSPIPCILPGMDLPKNR